VDYSEDTAVKPRLHYVQRWRLEKADPSEAKSGPKQAIVYWLDRNVPEKYRKSVAAGVLEWNKAFERIGFKDALVVKQQTEKDDFDTMDARHASIRWFTGADVGFAIGPSQVDPRTGEILDADIGMSDVFARARAASWSRMSAGRRPGRTPRFPPILSTSAAKRPAAATPPRRARAAFRHGPARGARARHGRPGSRSHRAGVREVRHHA